MTRAKKVVAGVVLTAVVSVAGVGIAALVFRLRGSGSGSALNTALSWSSAGSTSDSASNLDPAGPGMNPSRASYNIASSESAVASGVLELTINNTYAGHWVTVNGTALGNATGLKVQRVTVSGTDAALVDVFLDPLACGKILPATSPAVEVPVAFQVGAVTDGQTLSFTFNVEAVPSGEYSAGSCNSW